MNPNTINRIIYGNSYCNSFPPDPPVINRNTCQSFFNFALQADINLLENKIQEVQSADVKHRRIFLDELRRRKEVLAGYSGLPFQKFDNELLIDLTVPRWFVKQAFPGSDAYLEALKKSRDAKLNESVNRTLEFYFAGKFDEAYKGFRELYAEHKRDYQILLNAALFSIIQGDHSAAILCLKQASVASINADAVTKARPCWLLARLYYALENFPLALEYAELSLKINSPVRHIYRKIVYSYFNGFVDKAMPELTGLIETEPGFRVTVLIDPDFSASTPLIYPLVDETINHELNSITRLRDSINQNINDPNANLNKEDRSILIRALEQENRRGSSYSFEEIVRRLGILYDCEKISSISGDLMLIDEQKNELELKLPELKSRAEEENSKRNFFYRHLPVKQIKYFVGNRFYTIFFSILAIMFFGAYLPSIIARIKGGYQIISGSEMMSILYAGVGLAFIFPALRRIRNELVSVNDTPDTETLSARKFRELSGELELLIRRKNEQLIRLEELRKKFSAGPSTNSAGQK